MLLLCTVAVAVAVAFAVAVAVVDTFRIYIYTYCAPIIPMIHIYVSQDCIEQSRTMLTVIVAFAAAVHDPWAINCCA